MIWQRKEINFVEELMGGGDLQVDGVARHNTILQAED